MKIHLTMWLMAFTSLAFGVSPDVSPLETRPATIDVLTNQTGMTLYVFDKDMNGKSVCEGPCAVKWPPVLLMGDLPEGTTLGVSTRNDGNVQLTYKGRPLYTFADDLQPGDLKGDGVLGIWHLVHP